MPTVYARDPITKAMVPVLGGITRATADATYIQSAGDSISGNLFVVDPNDGYDRNNVVVSTQYVDNSNAGMVVPYSSNNLPAGWLLCNGQGCSTTTYANLYNAIGYTYGGSGGTFYVPDMRGRIWVGVGSSGYFDTMNEAQGVENVTLDGSQVPYEAGWFLIHDSGVRTMVYNVGGSVTVHQSGANYRTGYTNNGGSSVGGVNMNLGFGGGSHSNLMWSMALHYIIKT